MSFRDIYSELRGTPKMNVGLAMTLSNRGLQKIYDESLWSFQLGESGWFTPSEVSAGTVTTTLGSSSVQADATAKAALNAIPAPFLITTFQFRIPAYAIYSIVAYNPGTGLITLDRPWMEPAGAGQTYQVYQCYYPAPSATFKRWLAVRDFTNAASLDWWSKKQGDLDFIDPQRTVFQNPSIVAPYKVDTRANSSTPGRMLFELYPQPLSPLPYALYYVDSGTPLVNPGDNVPFPLTDELVLWRAKEQAYLWCEENKGQHPELQKSDWQFLAEAAKLEYKERLMDIRKKDRDICDSFITQIRRFYPMTGAPYFSAITGQATVGVFP